MCECDILHIEFQPKSLLKSCLESVYKSRAVLLSKWNILPRNLYAHLGAMCELGAGIDDNDTTANV